MQVKKKALILLILMFLQNAPAFSSEVSVGEENRGMYIEETSIKELQNLFQKNNSNYYIPRDNWQVPAIFIKHFPTDFYQIEDQDLRNKLFIQLLSPLAMKVNENILEERAELIKIADKITSGKTLKKEEILWLEDNAKKYDVFTRLKGTERYDYLQYHLKKKIDIIPPSVLIAIAGIETDWGKSRFVKEGNALYKEILWNSREGMIPEDEKEDLTYSIKKFPTLFDAMTSFALKINSGVNYDNMRTIRAQLRQRRKIIEGRSLASSFVLYSPQRNFIGLLDYTITFYELINIDAAKLIYNLPLKEPAKKNFVIKT